MAALDVQGKPPPRTEIFISGGPIGRRELHRFSESQSAQPVLRTLACEIYHNSASGNRGRRTGGSFPAAAINSSVRSAGLPVCLELALQIFQIFAQSRLAPRKAPRIGAENQPSQAIGRHEVVINHVPPSRFPDSTRGARRSLRDASLRAPAAAGRDKKTGTGTLPSSPVG